MVGGSDLVGGRYRLQEEISSDAWAVRYEATDRSSDRRVLVEVLRSDQGDRIAEDLRKRARATAALSHPGIAHVLDSGEEDGVLFVVTEIVVGRSLAEHARRGDLSLEQALAWCAEILDALDYAHNAGLAHGDLRASRVIVTQGGRNKITGFTDPRIAATKTPEVPGDLAQTGAVLYQLVGGDVAEESLPRPLLDFVGRWADPAALPPVASAAQMREELLELYGSLARPADTAPSEDLAPGTVWPIPERRYDPTRLGRRVIAAAIALALIALGAFLWRITTRVDDVEPPAPPPTISPDSPSAQMTSGNQSLVASVFQGVSARGRGTLRSASEAANRPLPRDFSADGRGTSAEATIAAPRRIKLIP